MSTIAIHLYGRESYAEIYATLARIFPERSGDTARWIELQIDDVASITLFAPDEVTVEDETSEVVEVEA